MTITNKSTILLTDDAHRIQIVGNTAYIANWIQGGLQIWNVDPGLATPIFLGKYVDATSKSRGVQVVGNLAYVADQEFGLKVINISTPSAPTLVGNYNTPGTAYRVKVVGNKAYVADSTSGVQIIDVTTPSGVPTPVLPPFLGNAPTTDARTTDVVGNYLYVADYTSGLKIFNASSPFSPVGSLAFTPATPTSVPKADSVKVVGNYAYLGDGDNGLEIVNISNPAAPTLAGRYDTPGTSRGVDVAGRYAYVADGTSLQVINIRDQANPVLVDSYSITSPSIARGVSVAGAYAYVTETTDDPNNSTGKQVEVLNLSSSVLLPITKKGTIILPDDAHRIQVVGNTAYIANWILGGLQIWNVSNPAAPTKLGQYVDPTSKSRGVQVVGNLAYVADQEFGLKVIDVSTSAPTLVGNYNTPGTAYRVKVAGDLAYVADSTSGVQVIDVSNLSGVPTPTLPPFLGNATTTDARTTDVVGNLLYVADYTAGLKIFNISNPAAPAAISSLAFTPATLTSVPKADSILVVGNYAYLGDGDNGLEIVDISNPLAPKLVGNFDTPGTARGIDVVGNYAYVADGTSLQVIDLTNPSTPGLAGSYSITPGTARGVDVEGLCAYVTETDAAKQVEIFDVSAFDNNVTLTSGTDVINASTGNDTVTSSFANLKQSDNINGGANSATLGVDTDTLVVTDGSSTDTITINASSATNQLNITGTTVTGFESFDFGSFLGKVSYTGTSGNDWVKTGSGADTLIGGAGVDTLIGGTGNDIYVVDSITDVITENSGEGTDTIQSSVAYNLANVANIENLTLTGSSAISATGDSGNNVLTGNTGNNTLDGGAGADTLDGGAGIDTLFGGTGNDIYVVDSTTDIILEGAGAGTDTVQSSVTFSLQVFPNIENLTLTGANAINGTGNSGNNVLTGNTGNNVLSGGTGNDTLIGGTGNDTLIGGTGNDILTGGSGKDTLTGGTGTDRFVFTALADSLLAGYDVISDYAIGEQIDAPPTVAAVVLNTSSGIAASLAAADISSALGVFAANTAKAFTVTGQSGTFLAFNDATAAFNAATDSIVQLSAYSISATNTVTIV